jgi:hypothetical protein
VRPSWPTVAVVALSLAALVSLAALRVAPEYLAALGATSTVVAGAMRAAFSRKEEP